MIALTHQGKVISNHDCPWNGGPILLCMTQMYAADPCIYLCTNSQLGTEQSRSRTPPSSKVGQVLFEHILAVT